MGHMQLIMGFIRASHDDLFAFVFQKLLQESYLIHTNE